MRYRFLGKTGLEVSEIGYGAWGIGGAWWGGPQDDSALKSLHRAFELGLNFVDTAYVYGDGHSERLIAKALKSWSGRQIYVASKVPPKNYGWPANPKTPLPEAFPADWITSCTERTLKNLNVETLDLQQLHVWSDAWLPDQDWLKGLEKLKSQGKIRHFGVSINDHDPESALKLVASGLIDSVQVIYNIFDQSPQERLLPLCQKQNVGVIARVPLDEGALTGAFRSDTKFPEGDWRAEYFSGGRLQEAVKRAEKLKFLVRGEIQTLAQAALKFVLSHPAVSTVIPGMRKPANVESNVAISDGKPLTVEELKTLEKHTWYR